MDETILVPISADYLYEGMLVPHDIYSTGRTLLIAKGIVLSASYIERLRRRFEGEATILVSIETERMMRKQGAPKNAVPSLEKLEESTGYGEAKHEALDILEKISNAGMTTIPQDALQHISQDLSRTVNDTAPAVILDLVNALAPVDEYLQRHCINVGLLNGLFGKWLGLPKEQVDLLVMTGLLHDCGKASLPQKILRAPRPLTGIELEVIKTHPLFSYKLLAELPKEVQAAVRGHHEKMNGTGYPDGLDSRRIPYMARITAISDIYDAMTARRSYKNPLNPFAVLSWLRALAGSELDPELVSVFVQKMPLELIGKPVVLSDGSTGIVDSLDPDDVEHPVLTCGGRRVKTDDTLSCVSMYFENDDA